MAGHRLYFVAAVERKKTDDKNADPKGGPRFFYGCFRLSVARFPVCSRIPFGLPERVPRRGNLVLWNQTAQEPFELDAFAIVRTGGAGVGDGFRQEVGGGPDAVRHGSAAQEESR